MSIYNNISQSQPYLRASKPRVSRKFKNSVKSVRERANHGFNACALLLGTM